MAPRESKNTHTCKHNSWCEILKQSIKNAIGNDLLKIFSTILAIIINDINCGSQQWLQQVLVTIETKMEAVQQIRFVVWHRTMISF